MYLTVPYKIPGETIFILHFHEGKLKASFMTTFVQIVGFQKMADDLSKPKRVDCIHQVNIHF